jgi:hypothetical protein
MCRRALAIASGDLQSEFVSAVSHEFRTPLTTMHQLSEMLAGGRIANDAERHESYEVLLVATCRPQRLVESLLDFGRMEAAAYQRLPLVIRQRGHGGRSRYLRPVEVPHRTRQAPAAVSQPGVHAQGLANQFLAPPHRVQHRTPRIQGDQLHRSTLDRGILEQRELRVYVQGIGRAPQFPQIPPETQKRAGPNVGIA